jgi:hypothetical protein
MLLVDVAWQGAFHPSQLNLAAVYTGIGALVFLAGNSVGRRLRGDPPSQSRVPATVTALVRSFVRDPESAARAATAIKELTPMVTSAIYALYLGIKAYYSTLR